MRISARAVIVKDNKVLTIFRRKKEDGKIKEYFVLPGGGQEEGESLEQTVVRELMEELNVKINILGYLGGDERGNNYFHCEIVEGYPKLGGEELDRMTDANFYQPTFVDLSEIDNIQLFGKEFVNKAIEENHEKGE